MVVRENDPDGPATGVTLSNTVRGIRDSAAYGLLSLVCAVAAWPAHGEELRVTGSPEHPVQIRVDLPHPALLDVGARLRSFLDVRGYDVVPRVGTLSEPLDPSAPVWILILTESLDDGKLAESVNAGGSAEREGFHLTAGLRASAPYVFIRGRTALGIRAGAARLMARVRNRPGRGLFLDAGGESGAPFFGLRIANVSQTAFRQCPEGSPFKSTTDFLTWDRARLAAYPELFWQFGFNGLEVSEARGYGPCETEGDVARTRRVLHVLMDAARRLGLNVTFNQWGQSLFREGENLCWRDPKERGVMESVFRRLAYDYAERTDRLIVHVGDPGGCARNGCDGYREPQEIAAYAVGAFRRLHPGVRGVLSAWSAMPLWSPSLRPLDMSNYELAARHAAFGRALPEGVKWMDATYMPADFGVALHKWHNADQAAALRGAGRPVDIWGWYLADQEMLDDLWLCMRILDRKFSALPDAASAEVRSFSIEHCFHGWPQIINLYVAGQKMWNPRRPLGVIEREFCAAAFGPDNADAMTAVYEACEAGNVNERGYGEFRDPATDRLPEVLGTPEYARQARAALAKLETVKLPDGWIPNFTLPVTPQSFIDMLGARLRLLAHLSETKEQVDAARRREGASTDEREKAAAEIKRRALETLPEEPLDPTWRQDEAVVRKGYQSLTWRERIERL